MVKGGAIVPKTTLKVHQNIATIATILQEKVNVLENNVGHVTEIFVDSKIEPINNEIGNINSEIETINTEITSLTENIEGSYVSVVSKDGYLKDIEILGNTIQNQNDLADIRSVGDKVEGQELYEIPVVSCGKNLFNFESFDIRVGNIDPNGNIQTNIPSVYITYKPIKLKRNTKYVLHGGALQLGTIYVKSVDNIATHISIGSYNEKQYFNTGDSEYFYIQFNTKSTLNVTLDVLREGCKFLQLEEGTVATPYEPYQEDKLTILSSTPLEKVGDVADRIICKDGVWGIEKNTLSYIVEDYLNFVVYDELSNVYRIYIDTNNDFVCMNRGMITNIVPYNGSINWSKDEEGVYSDDSQSRSYRLWVHISKSKITTTPNDYVRERLPIKVIYKNLNPTFIPLPHDQQIKLRTFDNKTNINFLTEIEPTLKASVPKSLSATVSTHTEQIDNLGKELDKVKKLEESTVSTVTTESDFTTVTETSNGYFEDVKLKGRTLVNLASLDKVRIYKNMENNEMSYNGHSLTHSVYPIKEEQDYTFIVNVTACPDDRLVKINKFGTVANIKMEDVTLGYGKGLYVVKAKPLPRKTTIYNSLYFTIGCEAGSIGEFECYVAILEGDHTQNPPSFFERIKSVGQDVDEISVLSCNENLFDETMYLSCGLTDGYMSFNSNYRSYYIKCEPNTSYYVRSNCGGNRFGVASSSLINYNTRFPISKQHVGSTNTTSYKDEYKIFTTGPNDIYLFVYVTNNGVFIDQPMIHIEKSSVVEEYKEPQLDKKPLLYYNPTTDTWEKPVLKEWDSIEKHYDGKYYYHKRSGEVVLNSSDDWKIRTDVTDDGVHTVFSLDASFKYNKTSSYMICNRFNAMPFGSATQAYSNGEGLGYYIANDSKYILYCVLSKSKLSSQDAAGFKAWLQANPTIVVYQLETEEVYECTSIDLMSYENETNFIVNAGAIAPVSTLKVMCNINNVVRELQQKVSNLENYIQHIMIDALNNALNE
jgi:hypothetical protein